MKKLVLLFAAACLPLFAAPAVFAADFDYEIRTNYELNTDGTIRARTIVDVTNNVNTPSPTSLVIPVAGPASDISAAYQDGGAITSHFGAEENTIRLETTEDQSGRNNKWSVVINYDVKASIEFGDTTIVSVPPLDYGDMNITSETVTISADLSIGVAVARGPEPNTSKISVGKQILTWRNNSGPIQKAVGVLFGDSAVAEVRIETTLENDTWWWQTKTVTLPPDTNQQRVFLDSIEPAPTNVRLDVDGNILAEYRLRPQASVSVTGLAEVAVNNFTYALDGQSSVNDTPANISDRYGSTFGPWTGGRTQVESDAGNPAADEVEKIFDAALQIEIESEGSYEAARERADNLIGELRSRSIPARLVLGHIFGDGGAVFNEGQPHAWVEAYVAGIGWMTLDPTLELNGDYFGTTDVQHVGLVLRGVSPDFPPDQLFDTTVAYTDNDIPQTPAMQPELSATRYVVLPGLAIDSISAKLPAGVIVDNTGLSVDDGTPRHLGSLAPLQNAQVRTVSYGLGVFSGDNVKYGTLDDNSLGEVLAETTMGVNYIPMIILIVLALAAGFIIWLHRRRSPKRERVKRSKDAVVFATEDDGEDIEKANLVPNRPEVEQTEATEAGGSDTISGDETQGDEPETPSRPVRPKIQ